MRRLPRLSLAILAAAAVLLALALYLRAWGGVALIVVGAGGWLWYRGQVARGEAAERFFGDAGEDTRLTGFQHGAPSEMPPPAEPGPPPRH